MPYTAEISRRNPTCFLFLIDQSTSMEEAFGRGDGTGSKAKGLADAVNRVLLNLALSASKDEGIRNYFHIGMLGYGDRVGPAFDGALAGRELVPIDEIAAHPVCLDVRTRRVPDGAGGIVEEQVRFPIWLNPVANGGTPMCQAFAQARSVLQGWLQQQPNCYPPVVLHFTDGDSTDGDPTASAESLKQLGSTDGQVLLFNAHMSALRSPGIEFPDGEEMLPDPFAKLLFRMSSPLPPVMREEAARRQYRTTDRSRGFVFNSDLVTIVDFLEIGTRPANLLR